MKEIMKRMLLLVFVSMAILTVSALADQTKDNYNMKYPSEKCCPTDSCDKCNYNKCNYDNMGYSDNYNNTITDNRYPEKCKVECCDFEYCLKCGEKHYADGYCDKCGEKCSLLKYCPNDKRFYQYDGDHYCQKCGAFCYYIERCDKCGYNYKYDGYCDSCHKKCYFDQCCYMKCNNECREPCKESCNCHETPVPVRQATPAYNENTNYDMGTTGYPMKSASDNTASYNTPETTQPAMQNY